MAGTNSEGKLIEPRYVACDSQNNIIVSDSGDCNVKKFNSQVDKRELKNTSYKNASC